MNGCAAVIQRDHPKAVYFPCSSHVLNLCVMATSKIVLVSNTWTTLRETSFFFKNWTTLRETSFFFENSPKRQNRLEAIITEMPTDTVNESRKKKLVSLCRTCWVLRHTALVAFADLFPAVVATFEVIANNRADWNADSCAKASALLRTITDFSFLLTFSVVSNIMAYLHGLCVGLQEKSLDVCRAYKQIAKTQTTLENVRDSVDNYHATWWTEAVDRTASVNVQPSAPHTCGCQLGRDNVPADTPKQYFRRAVSVPLLDELLGQFTQKFGPLQQKIGKGLSLLPRVLLANPEEVKTDAMTFAAEYEEDLPAGCRLATLRAELDTSCTVLTAISPEHLPTSLADCAKLAEESLCKGVTQLLILLATLPVTTCSCERSIINLRRLKTYLRSTRTGEHCSGLALPHTHYGMPVNTDEVLKLFFRHSPCRILSRYVNYRKSP